MINVLLRRNSSGVEVTKWYEVAKKTYVNVYNLVEIPNQLKSVSIINETPS